MYIVDREQTNTPFCDTQKTFRTMEDARAFALESANAMAKDAMFVGNCEKVAIINHLDVEPQKSHTGRYVAPWFPGEPDTDCNIRVVAYPGRTGTRAEMVYVISGPYREATPTEEKAMIPLDLIDDIFPN